MLVVVVGFVSLVLLVYCVIDIARTPAAAVRTLPKLLWLVLVVLFPIPAGVGWLLAGRPAPGTEVPSLRRAPRTPPAPPDDDEDFLRSLRERAEEQRRAARRAEERDADEG